LTFYVLFNSIGKNRKQPGPALGTLIRRAKEVTKNGSYQEQQKRWETEKKKSKNM